MQDQKRDAVLELGTRMGCKQAFASLAGGCSAADAECLRQMRDQKKDRESSSLKSAPRREQLFARLVARSRRLGVVQAIPLRLTA